MSWLLYPWEGDKLPTVWEAGWVPGWCGTCSYQRMNPGQSRELEPFELLGTTWPVTQYCTPDEWLPQMQDFHTWRTQCCAVPDESNVFSKGSGGM